MIIEAMSAAHAAHIARDAYLDLLKGCLTRYSNGQVFLARPLTVNSTMEQLEKGILTHQDADTMIGWARLENARECVETVIRDGIPGDIIETGTWRGGCCMYMRAVLRAWDVTDRKVWLADSFSGFPEPDVAKYPEDYVYGTAELRDFLDHLGYPISVDLSEVKARFASYGLLDGQVEFLPGYFSDTLPHAPVSQLAVLRLDGDFYQSTYEALEHLYGKLSDGGFCIIDDYALETCRKAVGDFRSAHGITDPIEQIDWTGSFWRKASA